MKAIRTNKGTIYLEFDSMAEMQSLEPILIMHNIKFIRAAFGRPQIVIR